MSKEKRKRRFNLIWDKVRKKTENRWDLTGNCKDRLSYIPYRQVVGLNQKGGFTMSNPEIPSIISEIMSLAEVSNYVGVSKSTALKFIKQNPIKHLKIGREYKIIRKSLIEFLEAKNNGSR